MLDVLTSIKPDHGTSGPSAQTVLAVLALGLAIVGIAVAFFRPGEDGQAQAEVIGLAAAAVALVAGTLQWRAARHEASFERYYDRLEIANSRFDQARLAQLANEPTAAECHQHTMFVFAELDNLEYVLGKYRLGYVRKKLACRAFRHFKARCRDSDRFRERAVEEVDRAGYERTTRKVVKALALDRTRPATARAPGRVRPT